MRTMRPRPIILAMTLATSGCGRTELIDDSDAGYSTQTASTATGGSTTEVRTAEMSGTSTSVSSVIGIGTDGTGAASSASTSATVIGPTTTTAVGTAIGGSCVISPSSYDQSCTVDTECALVVTADFCLAGCECVGGATINVSAVAQYIAAVANTPLGSGALGNSACPCPSVPAPCCRDGVCTLSGECAQPQDTLAACASAGGTCIYTPLSEIPGACPYEVTNVEATQPVCAYADETCCTGPLTAPGSPPR